MKRFLTRLLGTLLRFSRAGDRHMLRTHIAQLRGVAPLQLRTVAFAEGGPIPKRFAKEGDNVAPPLSWSGVPAGAQELVIVMEDPDVPILGRPVVHLIATGIDPVTQSLQEGALNAPGTAMQLGVGYKGRVGYSGPGALPGHGPHCYVFQLVALKQPMPREPATFGTVVAACTQDNVLAFGSLTGTYER